MSPSGELFFAYLNPMNPDTDGVYRQEGDSDSERLPGSRNIEMANSLALIQCCLSDEDGLYNPASIIYRFNSAGRIMAEIGEGSIPGPIDRTAVTNT
jgi:hypothetical protein